MVSEWGRAAAGPPAAKARQTEGLQPRHKTLF